MVSDFLVRLSIRSAMFAGAITGFVFGLFAGATLGALISWFAGAIVDWQAQLGFSLGVTQQLLPLGDQVNSLETVADRWFLVIPGVGLLVGVLGALIGLLAGGLWAALVQRLRYYTAIPYRLNPDPLYVDRDGSLEQRDVDYDLVSVF